MKESVKLLIMILGIALFSFYSFGAQAPIAPSTLTKISDSRLQATDYTDQTIEAEAGNITEIVLTAVAQTKTWTGFYGNISGNITLDDADGNSFYDWVLAEPQGEVYASNASVSDWSTIHCVNYTNNGASARTYTYDGGTKTTIEPNPINLSMIEADFGILANDVDGLDETYNNSGYINSGTVQHNELFVGAINISRGSCPATDTYENSLRTGNNFQSVLLTINNTHTLIFTTIIENDNGQEDTDVNGYDNRPHDFQVLVLEDGHDGAAQDVSTTYYFYVEIE